MGQMYERKVWHQGLNRSRIVRARNPEDLRRKAAELMERWEESWRLKQDRDLRASMKAQAQAMQARSKEQKIALAEERTEEARQSVVVIENLLHDALDVDPRGNETRTQLVYGPETAILNATSSWLMAGSLEVRCWFFRRGGTDARRHSSAVPAQSPGGEDRRFDQGLAQGNAVREVDLQHGNRRRTDRGLSTESGAVPAEMTSPLVALGGRTAVRDGERILQPRNARKTTETSRTHRILRSTSRGSSSASVSFRAFRGSRFCPRSVAPGGPGGHHAQFRRESHWPGTDSGNRERSGQPVPGCLASAGFKGSTAVTCRSEQILNSAGMPSSASSMPTRMSVRVKNAISG